MTFKLSIALALIPLCAATARADIGGIGPPSKIGSLSTSFMRMGDTTLSAYKTGDVGPAKAMQPGLVAPSTSQYMGSIGGTANIGSRQLVTTQPLGDIAHSSMRTGDIGPAKAMQPGLVAPSTSQYMGSVGPPSKIGSLSTSYMRMGDTSVSAYKTGDVGPAKAMQPGLVAPSTSQYMGSIGGTANIGSRQLVTTQPLGDIAHSSMRTGMIGPPSIDILPRGYGIPKH